MNIPSVHMGAATVAHLQTWIGNVEIQRDDINATPVRGLSAALDRDDKLPVSGDALPSLWHWLYFLPQTRQSLIGADGHPLRGGFFPPVPLPRRMWAGGRLAWREENPLVLGDAVQRHSRIESVMHKTGRSGEMVFVVVKHEIHNANGLALTEEHDIVYRAGAQPQDQVQVPTLAETGAAWQQEVVTDAVMLFRYSALTFNGHRIHYDRSYATQVEGYPGLVVHGPLIATLLVDMVRRQTSDNSIKNFNFKAVRPAFDLHSLRLNGQPCGKSVRLWAQDHEGFLIMQGEVELA